MLGAFAATRVLLAMPPDSESYWLERGLLGKARRLTPLPVEQVVVPWFANRGPSPSTCLGFVTAESDRA